MVEKAEEEAIISSSDDIIYVDIDVLRSFMKDVFICLKVPEEDAEIIAEVLITSDLRGIDSHGIQRCKMYYDRIKAGIQSPVTHFEIVKEEATTAVADGHNGMGQVISKEAMGMAIEKAKKAIINAQNYGADVKTVQNLFNKAQEAATSQDYDTAEEKAKKAEKLAMEAQEHYYDNYISNEIKTLKENIGSLKNQGFDVTQAQELLSSINSLYLDKNFQEIGEKIKTIRELIIKMEEVQGLA